MTVPAPINTVKNILEKLNGEKSGEWILLENPYAVPTPQIDGAAIDFFNTKGGVILRGFLNTSTAEVRFYVAKFIDVEGRENLFS